ncbi:hypothetical protein LTR99_001162 [Exophiala xenobiotica]|uniref:Uncharacterized protein n=1 Tax=Vermiconidia calcicola TaxID=1690605 RepID=A0AAV9QNT5_9PEZI|nr:hypothetical protein LTR99_001162 [Exophiala xenobiotica]KAK5437687.1 hypothetical protein LTR34_001232 [Exophiala xenobiotica]KAK5545724.1 hypothetical protein LTR25_000732 [Vermiconidia calcicola]
MQNSSGKAHRSQNSIVLRRVERQNALRDSTPSSDSPSSSNYAEHSSSAATPSTTGSTSAPSSKAVTKPLQWVIYSAPVTGIEAKHDDSEAAEENETNVIVRTGFPPRHSVAPITIALKPDSEEASTCFFFRHYTGTVYDENIHSGFALMWQPLFLSSSADSPLRAATTAITVNITMMWCLQGCDTRPARKLLTKAISATRQAIQNPTPDKMNELLMTILIFDLYDSMVQHYVPTLVSSGKHKEGALALAQLRGKKNYDTPLTKGLVTATRSALLAHALGARTRLLPGAEKLFNDPAYPQTKAAELESIDVEIIALQARLWDMRRTGRRVQQIYEEIIMEAIRIDDVLVEWRQSITDPKWLPQYVHRDDVAPSLRAAGFYGEQCAVWPDLIFAEMSNHYYQHRLLNLQLIRQALADNPSLLSKTENRQLLHTTDATVQRLVDAVCDCIPFHLGDTVVLTNPMYSAEINFPIKTLTDPTTGETTTIPDQIPIYKTRAAASGGWTLFPYVCEIYRLAEPEDDAVPIALREGQLDWIKGQVKRMQKIFLYCDPVW